MIFCERMALWVLSPCRKSLQIHTFQTQSSDLFISLRILRYFCRLIDDYHQMQCNDDRRDRAFDELSILFCDFNYHWIGKRRFYLRIRLLSDVIDDDEAMPLFFFTVDWPVVDGIVVDLRMMALAWMFQGDCLSMQLHSIQFATVEYSMSYLEW